MSLYPVVRAINNRKKGLGVICFDDATEKMVLISKTRMRDPEFIKSHDILGVKIYNYNTSIYNDFVCLPRINIETGQYVYNSKNLNCAKYVLTKRIVFKDKELFVLVDKDGKAGEFTKEEILNIIKGGTNIIGIYLKNNRLSFYKLIKTEVRM